MILTYDSEGVNPLPDDITNKIVIIDAKCLSPEYQQAKYQLFKAVSGFGCHRANQGTAVIGYHLADKEHTRWERYELIGVANRKLLALLKQEQVESQS
jgi:hypothetical protein